MRVLLDAHVFIWAVTDSRRLSKETRKVISEATEVFVSAASIWEIAIKSGVGKIKADASEMARAITASGFVEMPVAAIHATQVARLPLLDNHKDPFDRLLVARSIVEPLVLLAADAKVAAYDGLTRTVWTGRASKHGGRPIVPYRQRRLFKVVKQLRQFGMGGACRRDGQRRFQIAARLTP